MFRKILSPVFFFISGACVAQSASSDSTFVRASVENAIRGYVKSFPDPVALHTGAEYLDHDEGAEGFPYFLVDGYAVGWVVVNGHRYDSVPIKYDCKKKSLILEHYDLRNYFMELELISERVDTFQIEGYKFFRLDEQSVYHGKLDDGFYNILYDGNLKMYAFRDKRYLEYLDARSIKKMFLQRDKFYVIRNGVPVSVQNKSSLWRVFKEEKKVLKKSLKEKNVDFKNRFEEAVFLAVKIADQMNNGL